MFLSASYCGFLLVLINFLHVMTYQNSSPLQSIRDQSTEKTIIEKDLEAGFGGVTNLLAYYVRYI